MKILIAGQFKHYSIENYFVKYAPVGVEITTYPAEDIFDDYYWSSIFNKLKFKLGVANIYQKIAAGLIAKAKTEKPDIIWVFKGMRILPEALKKLRSLGIQLVNYNPDHPFFFSSDGSGNKNVTDAIGIYDLHLCYSRSVQKRIEKEFKIPTAFLPFGHELSVALFEEIKNGPEILAACFVGNPDPIRAAHISALAENNIPVHVYGHDWEKTLPATKNITIHEAVYGDDFWRKLRAYRLQINVFRPHNEGSHNMRTFEIPAAGSIMLAPESGEHREFFEDGKEVFLYKDKTEMVALAQRILDMPKNEADAVRARARERSTNHGYTYRERAEQACDSMKNLLKTGVPDKSVERM